MIHCIARRRGFSYFKVSFAAVLLASGLTFLEASPSSADTIATFSSATTGQSGQTQQFTVVGSWSMAWSYDCGSQPGNFIASIEGSDDGDIGPNELNTSGSGTDYYTDSGTFDLKIISECDWTITIDGTPMAPPSSHGYWLVGSDGGIFTFGAAQFYGSTGNLKLQRPVVGITPTVDNEGYRLVASDGGIFSFGNAMFYGSIPGLGYAPAGSASSKRLNAPIVGMVPTSDGNGYFMVASDGGVFTFGDAKFEGSCGSIGGCSGAAVAVAPDASGNGYWLFTATGNVYAFGDAPNYGAPGNVDDRITSAVSSPDGLGYYILTSLGGVFTYGDATFQGFPLTNTLTPPDYTAIFVTSDGGGYWVTSSTGAVYTYGDAPDDGGVAGMHLNRPIIAASGS